MDMQADLFAEFPFGQIALEKIKPVNPNFRLFSAAWIKTGGGPETWEVMEVSGAEFRAATRGPNTGKLSIMVPNTKRTVHVHKSEIRAREARRDRSTTMTGKLLTNEHNEVCLHDVLKQCVAAGDPICVNGPSNPAVDAAIAGLAKETGKPVRVMRLVASDTTSLEHASEESIEAVLANSNVKVILKS